MEFAEESKHIDIAKVKLLEINEYLTCPLCHGYLIDATTITECLHSYCRSCILKFLQDNSHCPVCDLVINLAKPNLKPDKSLQDIVYKLVPELFLKEMKRRRDYYREHPPPDGGAAALAPEQRGEDTERTIFNATEMFSLSLEYASGDSLQPYNSLGSGTYLPAPRTREEHVRNARSNNGNNGGSNGGCGTTGTRQEENGNVLRRYLHCPGMCRIDVLKKFVSTKYNVDSAAFYIDILYKRVSLPGHYTLIDIAYIYSWKRNEPMKFFFRISDLSLAKENNCEYFIPLLELPIVPTSTDLKWERKSPLLKSVKKSKDSVKRIKIVNSKIVKEADSFRMSPSHNERAIATKDSVKKEVIKILDKSYKEVDIVDEIKPANTDSNKAKTVKLEMGVQNIDSKDVQKIDSKENSNKTNTIAAEMGVNKKIVPEAIDKKLDHLDIKLESQITKVVANNQTPVEKPKKPIKVIINVPKHLTLSSKIATPNTSSTANKNTSKSTSPSKNTQSPTKTKSLEVKNLNNNTLLSKINNNNIKKSPTKLKALEPPPQIPPIDLDEEKQNFLKSIELTAKSNLALFTRSPKKSPPKEIKQIKPLPAIVPYLPSSTTPLQKLTLKRKQSSHLKMERTLKRIKSIKGKTSPVKDAPLLDSVKDIIQSSPKPESTNSTTTNSALQTLFGNCNINIPSSLSITLKEASEDSGTTPIKPVINHIEILKLPDSPIIESRPQIPPSDDKPCKATLEESKLCLDRLDVTVSTLTAPPVTTGKVGLHPNLPAKVTLPSSSRDVKTVSTTARSNMTSSSFQKMFEEAIKKPEFSQKIHAYPVKQLKDGSTTTEVESSNQSAISNGNRKNILEIASQLSSKKAKIDPNVPQPPISTSPQPLLNSNGKVAIPRLPSSWKPTSPSPLQQTVASLHSASLGMNYTVSINQQNNNGIINAKVESPKASPKLITALPAKSPLSTKKIMSSLLTETTTKDQTPIVNGIVAAPPKVSSPRISTSTSPKPSNGFKNTKKVCSTNGVALSPKSNDVEDLSLRVPSPGKIPSIKSTKQSRKTASPVTSSTASKSSSKHQKRSNSGSPNASANELLEKYQIQNLAQLTAGWNLNLGTQMMSMQPPNVAVTQNQLALQQAVWMKHYGQNWSNPLMEQYTKYLQQTLNQAAAAQKQSQQQ